MNTMKAISFGRYGGPEVLELVDIDKPKVAPGEVLIKVHFAGLNPMCCKLRSGKFSSGWRLSLPAVMGFEVSGTIAELGSGLSKFASQDIGKRVLSFFIKEDQSSGGFAEYVSVPEALVHYCPEGLDLTSAGGLGLAGVTAWQCLISTARLTSRDTVLIHSAAGGVGQIAVQLAKLFGHRVIGTASPQNHQLLKDLGCDVVLDYHDDLFSKLRELFPDGIDVILETIGGVHQQNSYQLLAHGGRLVSIVGEDIVNEELKPDTFAFRIVADPWGKGLGDLCQLISEIKLKPHTMTIFDKKDGQLAHQMMESGHTVGKIVFKF